MSTPVTAGDPRRRADAVRNRQLVLDAAKVLLAQANTTVTVEDIAQQAGVGAGTVVRSFGSKDALLDAAVADLLGPFVERARESVSDTDPTGVLRRFLVDLIAFQAAHQLVGDQLRDVASPLTTKCRGELNAVALEMIECARRDGAVRTDIGHLTFEEAATLPCAAVTAWNALVGGRGLAPAECVLTLGSGAVSLFALQLAKLLGARVIATAGDDDKAARLTALGADAVINRTTSPEWAKRSSQPRRFQLHPPWPDHGPLIGS